MSFLCEEYIIIFVSREDLLRNSRLLCYMFSFLEEKKTRRRSGEKNLSIVCTNNCELSKLHTLSIYILYIQKRSISFFASAIPRLLFGSLTNREDKTVANCASYPGPPSVLEKDNGFFASSSSSSRNIL